MKRRLDEISMGDWEDPGQQPPKRNPHAGRMQWKPHGNPRLHPDEEAALAQSQPPTDMPGPTDVTADDLLDMPPTTVDPKAAGVQPLKPSMGDEPPQKVPIKMPDHIKNELRKEIGHKRRFHWTPTGYDTKSHGGPVNLNYAGAADIDRLMAEIKAEEAKPPHQQNAARIAKLKADAMELMQGESVKRQADRLLPRI